MISILFRGHAAIQQIIDQHRQDAMHRRGPGIVVNQDQYAVIRPHQFFQRRRANGIVQLLQKKRLEVFQRRMGFHFSVKDNAL
jgi:hypothetical protein